MSSGLFNVYAESTNSGNITVLINEKNLKDIVDADTYREPEIYNGRTILPVRAVSEALGCEVRWDKATQTAQLQNGFVIVALALEKDKMTWVDRLDTTDIRYYELDFAPENRDGRMMLPIRAISEAFDAGVVWDEDNKTVRITTVYDKVEKFNNGRARVKKGGFYGYIDTSKNVVVPFSHYFIMEDENLQFDCIDKTPENTYIYYKKDSAGKEIADTEYIFNGNIDRIGDDFLIVTVEDGKVSCLYKDEIALLKDDAAPQYTIEKTLDSGYVLKDREAKQYMLKKSGELIKFNNSYSDYFEEDKDHLCWAIRNDGEKNIGVYILKDGTEASENKYDEVQEFKGNKFAIVGKGDKYGIIDADGNEKISPKYNKIYLIENDGNFEYLAIRDDGGMKGYTLNLDAENEEEIEIPKYSVFEELDADYIKIGIEEEKINHYKVYDNNGVFVKELDETSKVYKYGIIKEDGTLVVKFKYDDLKIVNITEEKDSNEIKYQIEPDKYVKFESDGVQERLIKVSENGIWFYIDFDGNEYRLDDIEKVYKLKKETIENPANKSDENDKQISND